MSTCSTNYLVHFQTFVCHMTSGLKEPDIKKGAHSCSICIGRVVFNQSETTKNAFFKSKSYVRKWWQKLYNFKRHTLETPIYFFIIRISSWIFTAAGVHTLLMFFNCLLKGAYKSTLNWFYINLFTYVQTLERASSTHSFALLTSFICTDVTK